VWYCRDFGVRPHFDRQFGRAVQWDTDQLEGYDYRFLSNISPIRDVFNPLHAINPGALTGMFEGYDALWVNGYVYPSNWLAALGAWLTGAKLLFRSDLRAETATPIGLRSIFRDVLRRGWISHSDGLLYIGHSNRQAYVAYGADERQLFPTPYSVDVDAISDAVRRAADNRRELRARWSVPEQATVVLFVGKLTPRKHPEALLHIAAKSPDLHFVVAGSGPLEDLLVAEAKRTCSSNVSFLGFVNQSQLPDVYALSDIFVMPSEREPWGLVLNEAMAARLPAVVSRDVGAVPDLIIEGETGFTFPMGDWDAMAALVRRLATDVQLRRQIGDAASRRAQLFTFAATADGIVEALRALGVYKADDTAARPEEPSADC
jgi:glycosyltransferase involved in cell wall biosynthesis